MNYLINPTFRDFNTLFVLLLKNSNDDPTRDTFDEYYMSLVKIKDLSALIEDKPFYDLSVKEKTKNQKRMRR